MRPGGPGSQTPRMDTKLRVPTGKVALGDRRVLTDDVLSELTAWGPPECAAMLTAWHRASVRLVDLTVLWVLRAHGPQTMGHLAARIDVSVAGLTHIVERMAALGLVERRHDSRDRRRVIVHPIDRGIALVTPPDAGRLGRLEDLLAHLSDDELGSLLVGIRALAAARDCAANEAPAPVEARFREATAPGSHAR
jgi:DNA-binding MarR family transcriptional regulator